MKLFWKIYGAVLALAAGIVLLTSFTTAAWYLREAEDRIAEQHCTVAGFVAREIEKAQAEGKFPFQSLARLSESKDTLFWWVVKDDLAIHLADEASFMGTRASDYFPQATCGGVEEKLVVNRNERYGIAIHPFSAGNATWSFWLGFSTRALSAVYRRAVFMAVAASAAALLILGLAVYAVVMHFLRPVNDLTAGIAAVGKGDLAYSVPVSSQDELGHLAQAFNSMTSDLHRTTVSRSVLTEANSKLQREISEKNDFLRVVSHDMGAPLRNVIGMADSIMRRHGDGLPEEVKDRLARIRRNAGKEMDLISELLELSRIRTRRGSPKEVDTGEIVRDIAASLTADLEAKRILFSAVDEWPLVLCEEARIAQVFQNLIDNAAKYMEPRDGACIEAGWCENDTHYVFHVQDNGPGIAPEDQKTLFHVFRRGRNAASQAEGKGVGLAAVKAVAETYDGEAWVESELGKGSTFYFSLAKTRVSRSTNGGPAGPTGRVGETAEPGVEG